MLRFLLNASLAFKMVVIMGLVAVLFLGTLLLVYLPTVERELRQDRKDSLRHLVEVTHSLLIEYDQRVGTGELSLAEAQNRAIHRIGNLRYEPSGYFWLNDTALPSPRFIMHPIVSNLIGAAIDQAPFPQARQVQYGRAGPIHTIPAGQNNLLQTFVDAVNHGGEGYVTYHWPKPTPNGPTEKYYPKESFVRLFEPWGWIIGSGSYIDDIQARLARLRWTILAATGAILAAAMLLLAVFMALFVTRPMAALMHYAEKVSAGDWTSPVAGRFYGEAARLKSVITQMVHDLEHALQQANTQRGEALRESEKNRLLTVKLNALFKAMTELVVLHELVLDESGQPVNYRITDCNAAFEEATGLRKADVVGKLATEFYFTETAPHLNAFAHVARSGEPLVFETRTAQDERYFLLSVASLGNNEFVTIATDITKRKRTEQLIANKNKELEQLVYATSHDLRSPLVNIDGYGRELGFAVAAIQAAGTDSASSSEKLAAVLRTTMPEMTNALHHIRNSTRQMDALIKGLLDLSRAGRSAIDIGPVDMDALIAKVVSSLDHQLKHVGAQLHRSALPPCKGDAIQLSRVFANLFGNALKFLDPQRPGVIAIRGTMEAGRCVYCVEDNGIGIAPEYHGKIFELFHRLDPARTEGEGLGLAIVQQILGRLDGAIWVESTPGTGSRFFVSLPSVRSKDSFPGPV